MGNNKCYSSIDLVKFICSLLIVAVHTWYSCVPNCFSDFFIEKLILRSAVPFFFVVSGFFLGAKLSNNQGKEVVVVKQYCHRLFLPLFFFSIINYGELIYSLANMGFNSSQIITEIFKHIIFYPKGALWFLQACILGAILAIPFILNNFKWLYCGLIIAFVLFSFGLLCNTYHFVIKFTVLNLYIDRLLNICYSMRNGVTLGMFYLLLGIFLFLKHKFISLKMACGFMGASLMFLIVELIIIWQKHDFFDDNSIFIGHILFIPSLVVILVNRNVKIKNDTSVLLRNLSSGIYYTHQPLMFLLLYKINSGLSLFLVTSILSMTICMMVYKWYNNTIIAKLLR